MRTFYRFVLVSLILLIATTLSDPLTAEREEEIISKQIYTDNITDQDNNKLDHLDNIHNEIDGKSYDRSSDKNNNQINGKNRYENSLEIDEISDMIPFPVVDSPLETCKNENDELLQRLERLESIFNVSQFNPDLDDISLMELMYMSVKEKILNSVPDTDESCSFNLITGKCAPSCYCEFKPMLGDYTPSRMCRIIPKEKIDTTCDHSKKDKPWIVESAKSVKNILSFVLSNIAKNIKEKAPPSDIECKFSLPSMECYPRNKCVLDYQFGDYSPSRSCRYRIEDEKEKNILTGNTHRELVGSP